MMKNKYLAFVLTAQARAKLLEAFPPKHGKVIAHHVTIQFNVDEAGLKLLEGPQPTVKAVAYGGDEKVDCVLVNFNGTCKRPNGLWYHCTLSTSPQGKPVDSNAFLKANYDKEGALSWNAPLLLLDGALKLVDK